MPSESHEGTKPRSHEASHKAADGIGGKPPILRCPNCGHAGERTRSMQASPVCVNADCADYGKPVAPKLPPVTSGVGVKAVFGLPIVRVAGLESASPAAAQRRGLQTTEFWLTLIVIASSILAASFGAIDATWAAGVAGVCTAVYAVARTAIKLRHTPDLIDELNDRPLGEGRYEPPPPPPPGPGSDPDYSPQRATEGHGEDA